MQSVDVYEPDPNNYRILIENVKQNRCVNVSAYPGAIVGDHQQSVWLTTGGATTGPSILPTATGAGRHVAGVNIGDALAPSGANVVKIDAEGAEVAVIAGITDWSPIDRLVLEYHTAQLRDWDGQLWLQTHGILRRVFSRHHMGRCVLSGTADRHVLEGIGIDG